MKVAELEGIFLDYWVAKAEGHRVHINSWGLGVLSSADDGDEYYPSTDWSRGGPIIENQDIAIAKVHSGLWLAIADQYNHFWYGKTPLIAAMRCFVASKFGDEVPDELPALGL